VSAAPRTADGLFERMSHFPGKSEDFFTEALAATLGETPSLARGFCAVLAGARTLGGVRLSTAKVQVFTQQSHREQASRTDMRLVLNGKVNILLEHKLLSPESNGQTGRYAKITGVTHFAVIAARPTKFPGVREAWGDRLLAPSESRMHFLWGDFYDLIAGQGKSSSRNADAPLGPLERALVGLFDRHLLQSSHPVVGQLTHADPETRVRENTKFRELLGPTERALQHGSRGWSITDSWEPTAKSELWVEYGSSKRLLRAWIDPRFNPGALRVRLTGKDEKTRAQIERALKSEPVPALRTADIRPVEVGSGNGRKYALDLYLPWSVLLRRCTGPDRLGQAARALKIAIVGIIDRAS
jgi:hypothetical protein